MEKLGVVLHIPVFAPPPPPPSILMLWAKKYSADFSSDVLWILCANSVADPEGGPGGQDPPPFVPRCRLFNIGPKIGPPSGPPFFAGRPNLDPPLSKMLDPPLKLILTTLLPPQKRTVSKACGTQDLRGGGVPRSAKQANKPNKRATELKPHPCTHQGSMFRPGLLVFVLLKVQSLLL